MRRTFKVFPKLWKWQFSVTAPVFLGHLIVNVKFVFSRPVLFYNTLGQSRDQVVKIYVNKPNVIVRDNKGAIVLAQIEPFWGQPDRIVTNKFKVL